MKTISTYKEVAEDLKLDKVTSARFVYYMTKRWKDTEEIKCMTRYAVEWAIIFNEGVEYQCSDLEGLRVLRQMDTCENCHERLTGEELLEAVQNVLTLGEIACDDCYQDFISQRYEERKHPDEK